MNESLAVFSQKVPSDRVALLKWISEGLNVDSSDTGNGGDLVPPKQRAAPDRSRVVELSVNVQGCGYCFRIVAIVLNKATTPGLATPLMVAMVIDVFNAQGTLAAVHQTFNQVRLKDGPVCRRHVHVMDMSRKVARDADHTLISCAGQLLAQPTNIRPRELPPVEAAVRAEGPDALNVPCTASRLDGALPDSKLGCWQPPRPLCSVGHRERQGEAGAFVVGRERRGQQ
eukprot:7390843-Prymnesium_polylepis.1